jgi:hypothetical protein
MAFGDFAVTRPTSKTVTGADGNPVTYPPNFPAFEWNLDGTYRGVNTGDTDITLSFASSNIGQAQGTIYLRIDLTLSSIDAPILTLIGANDDDKIEFRRTTDDRIVFTVTDGRVAQASIQTATNQSGELKIVGAYDEDDFVLYVNDTLIGTDTSGTVPATSTIAMGSDGFQAIPWSLLDVDWDSYDLDWSGGGDNMDDAFASLTLFKTRLSNTEILDLT